MSTALDFGALPPQARGAQAASVPPPPTVAVAVPPPPPAAPPTIRYAAEFVDEREARARPRRSTASAARAAAAAAPAERRHAAPGRAWTAVAAVPARAARAAAFFPDGRLPTGARQRVRRGLGHRRARGRPYYRRGDRVPSRARASTSSRTATSARRCCCGRMSAFADAAYLSLKHGIAAARADTVDDLCNARRRDAPSATSCAGAEPALRHVPTAPRRTVPRRRRRVAAARRDRGAGAAAAMWAADADSRAA